MHRRCLEGQGAAQQAVGRLVEQQQRMLGAALDCAFQLMILWAIEHCGKPSLPTGLRRYRQFRAGFPRQGVTVRARVTRRAEQVAEADVELIDGAGALVARIDGYQCALASSLRDAFARNRLPQPAAASALASGVGR